MEQENCAMKVRLFGKNRDVAISMLKHAGFEVVDRDAEFVVSYGGDGTLMMAEHAYPGVPKILLKDSMICKKCSPLSNEQVLQQIAAEKFFTEQLMMLEVVVRDKTLCALNDIILHNKDPRHAIRYSIAVNGRPLGKEVIGDGVIVATPFGSTAYYRSITDSYFELGIGLAFNNSTEQSDHVVLKDDSVITITISRGDAIVYADNQKEEITVSAGDQLTIRKSGKSTYIVVPQPLSAGK